MVQIHAPWAIRVVLQDCLWLELYVGQSEVISIWIEVGSAPAIFDVIPPPINCTSAIILVLTYLYGVGAHISVKQPILSVLSSDVELPQVTDMPCVRLMLM